MGITSIEIKKFLRRYIALLFLSKLPEPKVFDLSKMINPFFEANSYNLLCNYVESKRKRNE